MGGKEGTIPRAPNHYMGVEKLRGWRKISTISQVVSSVQYICFRKTSWFEHGAPKFFLPLVPSNLVMLLNAGHRYNRVNVITKYKLLSEIIGSFKPKEF